MVDIVKDAIDFYRNHFRLIFSVVAPVLALDILVTQILNSFFISENSWFFIQAVPGILSFIFYSIYSAGLIILFGALISGNTPPPFMCIKKAFSYLPLFVMTEVIVFVFTVVGFVLLIVPGIVIAVKLSLSQFFLILSGETPLDAVKQSFRATDGIAKSIFYTLILVSLPIFLVVFTLQFNLSLFNLTNPLFYMVLEFAFGCLKAIFPIILFRFFCIVQQTRENTKTA